MTGRGNVPIMGGCEIPSDKNIMATPMAGRNVCRGPMAAMGLMAMMPRLVISKSAPLKAKSASPPVRVD